MEKKKMYQVEYWTHELCGAVVRHASRVFADDELEAVCKVADLFPDGYGYYVNPEPSNTWHGHY